MNSKEVYDYIIKIQAIAKTGLIYSKDPYALTNYNEINDLSREFLENFSEIKLDRPNYFEKHIYPTPNISARVVILSEDKNKVLMVREASSQTYSLPGGWCDLYDSPCQTVINEARQEAGAKLKNIKLVGIVSRTPFNSDCSIPNYVVIFKGELDGELHEHEYETDHVDFFDIDNLPEISKKTSKEELLRFIKAAKKDEIIFD